MYGFARCHVELLSDSSPKRTHEMSGMLAQQEGAITRDFVGNEAAACHEKDRAAPEGAWSVSTGNDMPEGQILIRILADAAASSARKDLASSPAPLPEHI